MKRLGLAVIVVAAMIFGTESVLALLRQRNVTVVIEVKDQQPNAPTPDAAPPDRSGGMTIKPDSALVARVAWDYKIGPRFPETIVHANVTDRATGKIVASGEYKINCGTETLNCGGMTPVPLDFGVENNQGTRAAWPVGDYTVQVTRTFVGFKPVSLINMSLRVSDVPTQ